MKLFKKISATIIVLFMMVTLSNAQSRYKHVPRVKVDVTKTKNILQSQEPIQAPSISVTNNTPVDLTAVAEETYSVVEEHMVASTSNEMIAPVAKKNTTVKANKTVKIEKKANKQMFTEKVKNKSRLLDVKDAEKTNANIALILLIVFYILAFVFILIAVLMILGVIYATLGVFLAMLIIGIVFALAASVLLTLMKMGVV